MTLPPTRGAFEEFDDENASTTNTHVESGATATQEISALPLLDFG
jgi:hypothetical protein